MAKIIGLSSYDFTDKDGKRIAGTTVYFTEPFYDGKGIGEKPDKFSLTPEQMEFYNLKPGDNVRIYFKKNSSRVEDLIIE